jgi:integrase
MAQVFKPAARAAGIPELTFHDLRHTGASLMIAAGCHVKVIAEQMGHWDGCGRRMGLDLDAPL